MPDLPAEDAGGKILILVVQGFRGFKGSGVLVQEVQRVQGVQQVQCRFTGPNPLNP
jgi:hypothetical protein